MIKHNATIEEIKYILLEVIRVTARHYEKYQKPETKEALQDFYQTYQNLCKK